MIPLPHTLLSSYSEEFVELLSQTDEINSKSKKEKEKEREKEKVEQCQQAGIRTHTHTYTYMRAKASTNIKHHRQNDNAIILYLSTGRICEE